jgi:phosphoserine phosphatase
VVTCGLKRVWEKVLEREGLADIVKVVGGGRLQDGYVVTAEVKVQVVTRLQKHHRTYVWAFGDNPLDVPIMKIAYQAIVVLVKNK